jgi:hypothetical protein
MGWSGGSSIAMALIRVAKKHVSEASKPAFYKALIHELESNDCDTLGECMGADPAFDKALKKANPGWFDDEEEDES